MVLAKASRCDDSVGGRRVCSTKNADAANEGSASTANASDSARSTQAPRQLASSGLAWAKRSLASDHAASWKGPKVSARNTRLGTDRSHCCSAQRGACQRMSPMANAANPGKANNTNNDHRIRMSFVLPRRGWSNVTTRNVLGPKPKPKPKAKSPKDRMA